MSDPERSSFGSDRSRRRRLSKPSPIRGKALYTNLKGSHQHTLSGPNQQEVESLKFLSSSLNIWQTISSFDSRRRSLVESIGFGGLLSLPCISSENKYFSYWLLSHLKWFTASLNVGQNISLAIHADNIGKITGLPCEGFDISDTSLDTVTEKVEFINSKLSFLAPENGVIAAAERFVQKPLPSAECKQDSDNFKLAFVIYAIGRFLAPSSKHPDGNTNFWGALSNPDEIHLFNWSSYVLSNILEAARLVNWVIPYNKPLTSVIGCTLIIQIFYLDNIDFGQLNLDHQILPRWTNFADDRMKSMIAADTIVSLAGTSCPEYGRLQSLRQSGSCYNSSLIQPLLTVPCSLSTSAPILPMSQRQTSNEKSSTPDISEDDSTRQFTIDSPLPTIFKTPPSFESEVLDFNVFINNKYSGQVDSKLLDDLKVYNARCLRHLANSYRSLASSIVNENAHIAMRFLDHHNKLALNCFNTELNNTCRLRRRRFNDYLGNTDSSTDGEDNIPAKNARTETPIGFMKGTTSANQYSTVGRIGLSANDAGPSSLTSHFIESSPPSQFTSAVSRGSPDSGYSTANSKGTTTPCLQKQLSSSHNIWVEASPAANSESRIPNYKPIHQKSSAFETPEATIKMALSEETSPTTENRAFSGACVSVRILDQINAIDLNNASFDEDYSELYGPKKNACPGKFCESHFSVQFESFEEESDSPVRFIQWLTNTNSQELESNWIMHGIPRFISIFGANLKEHIFPDKTMSLDLFDLCIRRMNQLDKEFYPENLHLRWRHLIESDYAMHVLGFENPVENRPIREQFVGPEVYYELSRCCLFVVPVFVNGTWWSYIWDLKNSVVSIIDPSSTLYKDEILINKHRGTINQLSKSLVATISDLFRYWSPSFEPRRYVVVRIPGMPYRSTISGLLTLFCIWHYDGTNVTTKPTPDSISKFKAFILYQLLMMKGNTGRTPNSFMQSLY